MDSRTHLLILKNKAKLAKEKSYEYDIASLIKKTIKITEYFVKY